MPTIEDGLCRDVRRRLAEIADHDCAEGHGDSDCAAWMRELVAALVQDHNRRWWFRRKPATPEPFGSFAADGKDD